MITKQRYKITIEYLGRDFHGWQEQNELPSIQSSLQKAIKSCTGQKVVLYGAGRTDAGVHATGQVAHFDLENSSRSWHCKSLTQAINYFLKPLPIVIVKTEIVDMNFHARFSAKRRSYIYRIINRPSPSAIDGHKMLHVPEQLDVTSMVNASKFLIGKMDFTSFRSTYCQAKSPIKSIDNISISNNNDELSFFIQAPSFLHNQIRIIIGTLRKIGNGKWSSDTMLEILEKKNRVFAGPTAPPHGLSLFSVDY